MQVQDVLLEVRQASVPTCANPRVARDFTGCGKTRCCKEPDSSRTVPAPDFLAAATISPGERVFKPAKTLYLVMTGLPRRSEH